jgi:phenylalanyl-tRNA synthetase beta chain
VLYPMNSEEPFKIGKAKVRGTTSYGMICAEDELGLGHDHDGIMVLPDEVETGTPAADYYNVTTDYIIVIDLTPNRSDATSHIGVAEDLAAYLKINGGTAGTDSSGGSSVYVNYPDIKLEIPENAQDNFRVDVENSEACPRYAGIVIDNIKVGESPAWLRQKLTAIGVRPVNNIVDITNFVLHEMGQPLHAFDADKIAGAHIIVKTVAKGTKFVTLDGVERSLGDTDLMICNGDGESMCIGGVFGGIGTGVTEQTTRIFIESAHFNPEWIRRTSMGHLLRTDAARTFEKSTDPNMCVTALKRAAELIVDLANGIIASQIIDIYPQPIAPLEVPVRWTQINKLIGVDIPKEMIREIFDALSMKIVMEDDQQLVVAIPTNKADVSREADVVEEILRIYGFDEVSLRSRMEVGLLPVSGVTRYELRNMIGSFLAAQGFSEMQGLSLTEDENLESGVFQIDANETVLIQNTSNISVNTMRPDLMVSSLEAVRYNQNRNQEDFRLFEFGRGYVKIDQNGRGEKEPGIRETEYLSLTIAGKEWPANWIEHDQPESDYYTIKKYVDAVSKRVGFTKFRSFESEDERFEYGQRYAQGGKDFVEFGKISEKVLGGFDVRYDVYFAQFKVEALFDTMSGSTLHARDISKYPAVKRDLAFVLDSNATYSKLAGVVRQAAGPQLKALELFDVYKNEKHLGQGLKSYAIQLVFEDDKRTLTDADVDAIIKRIVSKVEEELGGKLRG